MMGFVHWMGVCTVLGMSSFGRGAMCVGGGADTVLLCSKKIGWEVEGRGNGVCR